MELKDEDDDLESLNLIICGPCQGDHLIERVYYVYLRGKPRVAIQLVGLSLSREIYLLISVDSDSHWLITCMSLVYRGEFIEFWIVLRAHIYKFKIFSFSLTPAA